MENSPTGRRALAARKWFADNGPPDLQPLPLGYNEREALKHGGADHILAWYSRSLDGRNYDVLEHPSFDDYARGVMASEHAPDFIRTEDTTGELHRRFPPRHLYGLGPGLYWDPPKRYVRPKTSCRRRKARQDNLATRREHPKPINACGTLPTPIDEARIQEAVRRAAALAESFYRASTSSEQPEN
jgi:hypothetical protein